VSIVIVSYNDALLIKKLLASLRNQDYTNYEVVLVDNAGNNDVRAIAEKNAVRYYASGSNLGYTGGNNLGVVRSKGEVIFVLNPDTKLAPNAVSELVRALMSRGERCMVVVPKVLIKDSNVINSVGMRRFSKRANLYANIGYLEVDHGQFNQPVIVEAFDGAAFLFRRNLLSRTFLFNPTYFGGADSTDLAERVRKLGGVIWTCPSAIVRHEIHATYADDPSGTKVMPIMVRNNLAHTLTNLGPLSLIMTGLTLTHFSLVRIRRHELHTARLYVTGMTKFVLSLGSIRASTMQYQGSVMDSSTNVKPKVTINI
jgi:GT2 family glycosyltransferase